MPPQHKACIEFKDRYPESKDFLIAQLADRDPRIAAYAFKCLARVADIRRSDIPDNVIARDEKISSVMHSFIEEISLGQFISRFFDRYSSRDELLEEQNHSMDWQENELAEYKRRLEYEADQDER